MAIRKRNYWLSKKDALELEKTAKGEETVKFAFTDVLAAFKDVTRDVTGVQSPAYMDPASGIPHHVSHPSGPTPLEPRDADFDKIRARSGSNGSKDDLLAVHAAYIGEDPSDKKSFALPHHLGTEPHACNHKAVKSCLKALGVKVDASGVVPSAHPEIPEHGNQVAKSHLLTHMNEFKAAAEADKVDAVNAVKAAMQEDDHGDGYVVSNPTERGIRYEDVHQGNVPLASTDSIFDEKGERLKAQGDAQKLTAISAAFQGGDDVDQRNYLYVHHDSGGKTYLDALKKAARTLNVANTTPVKSSSKLDTENIARSHIRLHLQQFGIN
jgi:hypothetical protein